MLERSRLYAAELREAVLADSLQPAPENGSPGSASAHARIARSHARARTDVAAVVCALEVQAFDVRLGFAASLLERRRGGSDAEYAASPIVRTVPSLEVLRCSA